MTNARHRPAGASSAGMTTGRLEAFSDGVFAIAVTLLVLDIKVPRLDATDAGVRLLPALLAQWPNYLAYVTSFVTILIMWVNHHTIFKSIHRADHLLVLLNGLLLLCVTFIPFPTSLLAEYIQHEGQQIAAIVYAGTFLVTAIVFNLLWLHAARRARVVAPQLDRVRVRAFTGVYLFGLVSYLAAFLLAFVNVGLSVGICIALAVVFALPTSLGRATFE